MSALVVTVMGLVSPYLAKGAEEFVKAAGKDAYEDVKVLVNRLKDWWSDKPAVKAAAETMSQDPEENVEILARALDRELARNPAFEAELRTLVNKAAPFIEVVQKIEIADGVTGARIEELLKGTVSVRQDMTNAKNVVGVDVKRVG